MANAHQQTLKQAIVTAKHDSWRRFCDEATEENLWSAFKKVTRPHSPHIISTLEVDGQRLYDDSQKATALMQKFFPTPSEQDSSEHIAIEEHLTSLLPGVPSPLISSVTAREIHSAIWASGAWKAAGPDQVLNLCLRQRESILLPHLIAIFSASLQCHFLLSQWRRAEVLAVPKLGGGPSLPKGYYPISLLSCISKVLEQIVIDRLTFFLETQFQFSDH